MTESFADYPETIGERRSYQASDGSQWSPRDALLSLLRDIDRGDVDPDALIVAYSEKEGDRLSLYFRAACPDGITAVGLIERVKLKVIGVDET